MNQIRDFNFSFTTAAIRVVFRDDEGVQRQVAVSGVYICNLLDLNDPGFVFTMCVSIFFLFDFGC